MFTPATTYEHFQEIDTVITAALELTDKDASTEDREAVIGSALSSQHHQEIRTNLLNSSEADLAAYRAKSEDYKNCLVLLLDIADRKAFAEKITPKPTEAEQQALIARLAAIRAQEQLQAQLAAEAQRKQAEALQQQQELLIQQQLEEAQRKQREAAQELAAKQAADLAAQQRAHDEARRQAAHAEVARIGL